MKRLIIAAAVCCIISTMAFSETAHAKSKVTPFQGDNPSFITGGKVVLPTGEPGMWTVAIPNEKPSQVGYYQDGHIQWEYYNVSNPNGVPAGIFITYMDEGSKEGVHKGRMSSIAIDDIALEPSYSIEYYGKTDSVKTVTYLDNYFGEKQVWNYNKNGTFQSSDSYYRTGGSYGNTMIQSEHVDYSCKMLKEGKIEATKTAYAFNYNFVPTGDGESMPVLTGKTITTTIIIYNGRGNIISETINGVEQIHAPQLDIKGLIYPGKVVEYGTGDKIIRTVCYDANGNITSVIVPNPTRTNELPKYLYVYDSTNKIVAKDKYDSAGRRVSDSLYIYLNGKKCTKESETIARNAAGQMLNDRLIKYEYYTTGVVKTKNITYTDYIDATKSYHTVYTYYADGLLESRTLSRPDAKGNLYYHYIDENSNNKKYGRVDIQAIAAKDADNAIAYQYAYDGTTNTIVTKYCYNNIDYSNPSNPILVGGFTTYWGCYYYTGLVATYNYYLDQNHRIQSKRSINIGNPGISSASYTDYTYYNENQTRTADGEWYGRISSASTYLYNGDDYFPCQQWEYTYYSAPGEPLRYATKTFSIVVTSAMDQTYVYYDNETNRLQADIFRWGDPATGNLYYHYIDENWNNQGYGRTDIVVGSNGQQKYLYLSATSLDKVSVIYDSIDYSNPSNPVLGNVTAIYSPTNLNLLQLAVNYLNSTVHPTSYTVASYTLNNGKLALDFKIQNNSIVLVNINAGTGEIMQANGLADKLTVESIAMKQSSNPLFTGEMATSANTGALAKNLTKK